MLAGFLFTFRFVACVGMKFHEGLFRGGPPQSPFLGAQKVFGRKFFGCVNGAVVYTPFSNAF